MHFPDISTSLAVTYQRAQTAATAMGQALPSFRSAAAGAIALSTLALFATDYRKTALGITGLGLTLLHLCKCYIQPSYDNRQLSYHELLSSLNSLKELYNQSAETHLELLSQLNQLLDRDVETDSHAGQQLLVLVQRLLQSINERVALIESLKETVVRAREAVQREKQEIIQEGANTKLPPTTAAQLKLACKKSKNEILEKVVESSQDFIKRALLSEQNRKNVVISPICLLISIHPDREDLFYQLAQQEQTSRERLERINNSVLSRPVFNGNLSTRNQACFLTLFSPSEVKGH